MRLFAAFALASSLIESCVALGGEQLISFHPERNALKLAGHGHPALLVLDEQDWPGVVRAGHDLAADFGRVTGSDLPELLVDGTWEKTLQNVGNGHINRHSGVIIAGTIGKSPLIDSLIESGKIDVDKTKGKWESFQSEVVKNPIEGVRRALIIAGSDKRGTIYGLYDVSEQIGVSPWHWFADVPAERHSRIYALDKKKVQGPPSVKYRGIFLNDEQPALTNWYNENYPPGDYNGYRSGFYVRVFELLLRLRANYLWPAEWDGIFDLDDPKNSPLAEKYGIVIGTSHTEPLNRWTKEQRILLDGDWNWETNTENVTAFLTEGVERAKNYERVWTMGMRGLGDVASPTITAESLAVIVEGQQEILRDVLDVEDLSTVPQLWCVYKEVGGYFQDGFRVPEDITLLWADDNWGNIQRLPVGDEPDRESGAGVYYHFDYVGGPRSYKWINTISLQKTWEQMHLAHERQARDIWIVNVGDLKPLEIPISHFMDLAYNHEVWAAPDSTDKWLNMWAAREFGHEFASEIADIVGTYGMYAGRRKYEMVDPSIYSVLNYNEADNVVEDWAELVRRAQSVYDKLRWQYRPAFFELVLHPCKAGHTVYDIHVTAAKNELYASQRRTSANHLAHEALQLFNKDHGLTREYHGLLDGKWNHMMDQPHLGYSYWQQPMRNTLPPLAYSQILEESVAGGMGVTVEGFGGAVPGDDENNPSLSNFTLVLPPIDPYTPHRWIEIFSRGTESLDFEVTPHNPWVHAEPSSGTISPEPGSSDVRVLLTIDWENAPEGSNMAFVNITSSTGYGNYAMPDVHLPVNNTVAPDDFNGFVESDATVSIEAEHFSRKTDGEDVEYAVIPGYGRTLSGVALMPPTAPSQTAPSGPGLEYDMYVFTPDNTANVTVYLGPSLNTDPGLPLKYAIAFDDAEPEVVQFVPTTELGTLPDEWETVTAQAVWKPSTTHELQGGGKSHTLKLWALEPGVVFQKIVVDLGGVRESYLGPPESKRL